MYVGPILWDGAFEDVYFDRFRRIEFRVGLDLGT
jgi:hypothetical protein